MSAERAAREFTLPLLATILFSIIVGVFSAFIALKAGYGIIVAMACYTASGIVVSLLLPLAFHKLIILRADLGFRNCLKGGLSGGLIKFVRHVLSEFGKL